MGQEAHLELTVVVHFEELLKTLLEDRIAKGRSHYVETSGHIYTRLHLYDANLINRRDKNVQHDARGLRPLRQLRVELDGGLQVTRVISVFLDVQMRTDPLFELLVDDFTGTDSDGASHEIDDS